MNAVTTTLTLPHVSLPNEIPTGEYHHGEGFKDFISSSNLKQLLISPKWFRYCQLHPEDNRISLENALKGSVYHDMLCSIVNTGETDSFYESWVVFSPPINPRTGKPFGYDTKAFTDAYNEFTEANPGRQICSQGEIDLSVDMIKGLLHDNDHLSKDVSFLIKHGKAEQSHFVEYQGGLFKYRTDLKTSTKIVDWKTCGFEAPKVENWAKVVVRHGYHISAAMYQFFEHQITGKWKTFYWIAQEKEPPYDFNIIDASNWAFEITNDGEVIPHSGAILFIKLLEQYLICKERDVWPGYSIFTKPDYLNHRIATAAVPGWEEGKIIEFHNR